MNGRTLNLSIDVGSLLLSYNGRRNPRIEEFWNMKSNQMFNVVVQWLHLLKVLQISFGMGMRMDGWMRFFDRSCIILIVPRILYCSFPFPFSCFWEYSGIYVQILVSITTLFTACSFILVQLYFARFFLFQLLSSKTFFISNSTLIRTKDFSSPNLWW